VKKFLLLAAAAAGFAASPFLAKEVAAQQRGPVSPVAIVDLTYIFANHVRFKALVEDMKHDVEAAESELKQSKEALEKAAERINDFNPHSPEAKQIEEDVAKRQADLQVQVNIQKRNFMEQEAKIYLSVYREVLDHVKYHAEKSGYKLVLRFNGDPLDGEDLQGVMQHLNRQVVYYDRTIDITPIILDACNANAGAPRQNRQPSAPIGTKPQGVLPRR
jgi:Skp family chaperone for outer membrane proteins